MTIALGVPFDHNGMRCALVCADSKVSYGDGATIFGSKVQLSLSAKAPTSLVIANAANDLDAAEMLSDEIASALCDVRKPQDVEKTVKTKMMDWYAGYSGGNPPQIEFVLAVSVGGVCRMFYCSPPNTMLTKTSPFAVGSGSRIVNPLLTGPSNPQPTFRAALARAAYWMYRAKQYEGTYCGGKTHLFGVSQNGGILILDDKEIEQIEGLGPEIERLTKDALLTMLAGDPADSRAFLNKFSESFLGITNKIAGAEFSLLEYLDRKQIGKRKKG